eukprot:TRINITY_DN8875_c0_g1_i1.p1 TRINITY_DN8875_c0_g1~~TRINITY_DN8875_c0_g1_i1.p1  ORF type:complete len:838 (+),score=200.85 TRINITY_DN8875_c0_g1_i1:133-2514(+)
MEPIDDDFDPLEKAPEDDGSRWLRMASGGAVAVTLVLVGTALSLNRQAAAQQQRIEELRAQQTGLMLRLESQRAPSDNAAAPANSPLEDLPPDYHFGSAAGDFDFADFVSILTKKGVQWDKFKREDSGWNETVEDLQDGHVMPLDGRIFTHWGMLIALIFACLLIVLLCLSSVEDACPNVLGHKEKEDEPYAAPEEDKSFRLKDVFHYLHKSDSFRQMCNYDVDFINLKHANAYRVVAITGLLENNGTGGEPPTVLGFVNLVLMATCILIMQIIVPWNLVAADFNKYKLLGLKTYGYFLSRKTFALHVVPLVIYAARFFVSVESAVRTEVNECSYLMRAAKHDKLTRLGTKKTTQGSTWRCLVAKTWAFGWCTISMLITFYLGVVMTFYVVHSIAVFDPEDSDMIDFILDIVGSTGMIGFDRSIVEHLPVWEQLYKDRHPRSRILGIHRMGVFVNDALKNAISREEVASATDLSKDGGQLFIRFLPKHAYAVIDDHAWVKSVTIVGEKESTHRLYRNLVFGLQEGDRIVKAGKFPKAKVPASVHSFENEKDMSKTGYGSWNEKKALVDELGKHYNDFVDWTFGGDVKKYEAQVNPKKQSEAEAQAAQPPPRSPVETVSPQSEARRPSEGGAAAGRGTGEKGKRSERGRDGGPKPTRGASFTRRGPKAEQQGAAPRPPQINVPGGSSAGQETSIYRDCYIVKPNPRSGWMHMNTFAKDEGSTQVTKAEEGCCTSKQLGPVADEENPFWQTKDPRMDDCVHTLLYVFVRLFMFCSIIYILNVYYVKKDNGHHMGF